MRRMESAALSLVSGSAESRRVVSVARARGAAAAARNGARAASSEARRALSWSVGAGWETAAGM
jgi:hypothetical protein